MAIDLGPREETVSICSPKLHDRHRLNKLAMLDALLILSTITPRLSTSPYLCGLRGCGRKPARGGAPVTLFMTHTFGDRFRISQPLSAIALAKEDQLSTPVRRSLMRRWMPVP